MKKIKIEQSALNFFTSLTKIEKNNLNLVLDREALISKSLSNSEIKTVYEIKKRKISENSVGHKSLVVVIKSTRACNLRCTYCNSWEEGKGQVMNFKVLTTLIYDALSSKKTKNITFVWHGGEPLLLPISYYSKALDIQKYFSKTGQIINNSFQTNGTRLTQEWVNFFKENNISLGVSIDGIKKLHDKYRIDISGLGSWDKVISSISLLNKNSVKYGVLMVITKEVSKFSPVELYESLIKAGISNISFLNSIPGDESSNNTVSSEYLPFNDYVVFLRGMYDLWKENYRNKIDIREFSALEYSYHKKQSPVCLYSGSCFGRYITINPNGDIGACDKYVTEKDFLYGNLELNTLSNLLKRSLALKNKISDQKINSNIKRKCKWFNVCNGGCPHDNRMNSRYETVSNECCGLSNLLNDIDEYHSFNN